MVMHRSKNDRGMDLESIPGNNMDDDKAGVADGNRAVVGARQSGLNLSMNGGQYEWK